MSKKNPRSIMMKKRFLAAVLGASALFIACGDDSSSSTNTDSQDTQTETGKPSGSDCFTLPEPNGAYQGCWYTSDETAVYEFEVTAVGLITRTWMVEDGKVIKSTLYDDGNPPLVDEELSMSSLEDALTEEKDGTCKKIKTAMCKD